MADDDNRSRMQSTRRIAGYVILAVNVIMLLWLLGSVHQAESGHDRRARTVADTLLVVWILADLLLLIVWLLASRKPAPRRLPAPPVSEPPAEPESERPAKHRAQA
jgi:hypothetical protein